MSIYLGIYLIIAVVAWLAVAWDDCTHDSPFKNHWHAAKTGAWVGILWLPLVLIAMLYWLYSWVRDRIGK